MSTPADAPSPPDESPAAPAAESTNGAVPRRRRGRPFAPGNRANPGGRPKTDARLKAALEHLSLAGVRELGRLLRDPKTPRAVRARIAEYVVDRRLGRPATQVTGADGQPLIPPGPAADNPITQLLARLAARRSAASAPDAPTSPEGAPAVLSANGEAAKGSAA